MHDESIFSAANPTGLPHCKLPRQSRADMHDRLADFSESRKESVRSKLVVGQFAKTLAPPANGRTQALAYFQPEFWYLT